MEIDNNNSNKDLRDILQNDGPEILRELALNAETYDFEQPTPSVEKKGDRSCLDAPPPLAPPVAPPLAPPPQITQASTYLYAQPGLPLGNYRVDHAGTLGLDLKGIDLLRPPYVINQIIRRGAVMLLGAESKSRKSWLANDAGLSVASGCPWLTDETGANGLEVNQAKVHIFDLELDDGEIAYRFAKTRRARFPHAETARRVTENVYHYSLDSLPAEAVINLIVSALPTISPGDLVIVDCFYRLCPDSIEPTAVAAILEAIKSWAKQTQAAWLVVDHFRKAGADKARDRFNGTFLKQASVHTLLGIEVRKDGLFELQVTARSFYGDPTIYCRWDDAQYRFVRVEAKTAMMSKDQHDLGVLAGFLLPVWQGFQSEKVITAKELASLWKITPQAARDRVSKLEGKELVEIVKRNPLQVKLSSAGDKLINAGGKPG